MCQNILSLMIVSRDVSGKKLLVVEGRGGGKSLDIGYSSDKQNVKCKIG